MELFRSWGLDEAIRAGDLGVAHRGWLCDTLAAPDGLPVPLGFASPEQSAALSPTTPVGAPQDFLEPILLDHLRGLPGVEIRFGAEVVGVDQHDHGVTVTARQGGGLTHLRGSHVIGADGAHSAVRAAAGIALIGPADLGSHYTVLFRAPLAQVVGARRYGLYLVGHPDAAGAFLPTNRRDRWVHAWQWKPEVDPTLEPSDLVCRIRTGAGAPDLPIQIERTGSFTFAAQIAQNYRQGRTFLVGDAAHRMTPRGGAGMNTAIHDGYDLGWKLAWVRLGWASARLLDTYEERRRPVGERNVARSAHECPRDMSRDHLDDLGERIPHEWVVQAGRTMSTLDLIGLGLTLLVGPGGQAWAEAARRCGASAPVRVSQLDAPAAAGLDVGRHGALLVRPDGQAVGRWRHIDSDGLAQAISLI